VNAKATRALLLTALAGAGLSGCGGSSTKSSSSSGAGQAASPSASSAGGTGTASAPTAAGGLAAAGAKYSVGSTALVAYDPDYSSNSTRQQLKITVQSITKGSLADFNGITLDASQKAGTPFYVKVRITNVGSGDASANNNDPGNQIEGIDTSGQAEDSLSIIGDFPRCNQVAAPTPMPPGKSFDTCLTFLIPGGITAAAYIGDSSYFNSPVTWK
jgi:hypothetical protein